MIQQLVRRLMTGAALTRDQAAARVLEADPFDLVLHMERVWSAFNPAPVLNPPFPPPGRGAFLQLSQFANFAPPDGAMAWDHLGYSYVLENSRAVQIFRRVVREYRSGEGLGIPSLATQRWLDVTETLLFGAANPISAWLSTSGIRPDSEAARRNAYWRFFGVDLAFGGDDNRPPVYDKATAANSNFIPLFEELLFELWQSISNVRNIAGVNASDDDRIFRLAEALQFVLRSRRLGQLLAREELAAATVLGWVDLTLSANHSVIVDTGSHATNPATRLQNLGAKVGLAPHSRSSSLFSMSADLSIFLRFIEDGVVSGPELAWTLYLEQQPISAPPGSPLPIGAESRRVITEWAAATGKDLKARARPIETRPRQLAGVR